MCAKSLQSCLTLCNPMDCSPPGSSVHGTLQARILEWIAMPSSRGCSQPKDQTQVSLHLPHWQVSSVPLAAPEKTSLVAQMIKNAMWETWVLSLGWEDPLEEGMATHSSTPAWRIPRTEEPGGLQSMGSQRVRHD